MGKHPLDDFVTESRLEKINKVLDKRSTSLTVVLDRVKNYHNVSAVIRSADAFGIQNVHLVGEYFEYSKGISRGTERWIDLYKYDSPSEAIAELKSQGYSLVVLQPEERTNISSHLDILPVNQLPFENKLALVFGNERLGVAEEFVNAASYGAFISMHGFVDSFNISVACAITLFCSTLSPAEYDRKLELLSDEQKMDIKDKWLKEDVNRSEEILRDIENRGS